MSFRLRGFTLLEILIVMVILGVLAGFAVLAVGTNTGRHLEQEARRLVVLADLARDEALLTGQLRALGFSSTGYAFLQRVYLEEGQVMWLPLEQAPLGARSLQASGLQPVLHQQGRAVTLPEQVDTPHIVFDGSGEMTPFRLLLRPPPTSRAAAWVVTGTREGRMTLEVES